MNFLRETTGRWLMAFPYDRRWQWLWRLIFDVGVHMLPKVQ